MTRHRWSPWGALVCALALAWPAAAAPVPAEQDALAQVPAKAPLVVQLRGFERTRERLTTLIKNAMPDYAAVAKEKMDAALKDALDGRNLDAVSKDGSIFVVFTELPNPNAGVPKLAFLIPVKSYETFRNGLLKDDERKALKTDPLGYESATLNGETVYFVNRKNGYAVLSPDPDVAASFVKKYDGLNTKLSKTLAQQLMAADVSLYVDMAAVNKEHGDAIKQTQTALEQLLENSPEKNVADMAKRFVTPIFQAVSDSTAVLVSVDLRPEGALLHTETEVAADSKTDAMLKGWKSLPAADVARLPAGQMIYSSMAYTPALMKDFGALAYGVADPDSAGGQAIHKLVDALADAKPRARLDASNVPASGLTVWKYDDPTKAVEAQMKLFKELKAGSTYGPVLKAVPVVKDKAEKAGGIDFHFVSLKWDLEKTFEKQAALMTDEQKKVMVEYMKSLLGEGTDVWLGTDGKAVVQVIAKDWPAARTLIERYQKGEDTVGTSQAFKDTVKHLPARNSALVLMDVPRYTEVTVKAVVTMLQGLGLPLPIPPGFETPAVKPKTSYLGLGLTLESGRGAFDLWLGASSVNDVYKMYLERLLKPNF